MKHRWGERRPIGIRVGLVWRHRPVGDGWLRHPSMSGGFILSDVRLAPFARAHVQLRLASRASPDRTRLLAGHIVRRDDEGLGIEWDTLAPAGVGNLLRRTSARRRTPRSTEREPLVYV